MHYENRTAFLQPRINIHTYCIYIILMIIILSYIVCTIIIILSYVMLTSYHYVVYIIIKIQGPPQPSLSEVTFPPHPEDPRNAAAMQRSQLTQLIPICCRGSSCFLGRVPKLPSSENHHVSHPMEKDIHFSQLPLKGISGIWEMLVPRRVDLQSFVEKNLDGLWWIQLGVWRSWVQN